MRRRAWLWAWLPLMLTLAGCPKDESEEGLTWGEAKEALEESSLSTQATTLVSGTVEISTNFTIGQAVEAAAAELRTFIESQLPCAAITLENATLSIEYGAKPGSCVYNGQTYSGKHSVTLTRNEEGNVQVNHTWNEISNQKIAVSGTAVVTWSLADKSRHVEHQLSWTRLSDGRTATGSGNRTQTALAGGVLEGIQVDGTRTWTGQTGAWETSINSVQMRWVDPVPQSGSYAIVTPKDKTLSMSFHRMDDDTIKVTIASGEKSFDFNVNKI